MKKVEHISDDQVIIDGVVFERAKPVEAKGWTPRKGEICEIWGCEGSTKSFRRFSHFSGGYFRDEYGIGWNHYAPLNDPLVIQLIPWEGATWEGAACPVDDDQYVIVRLRNGELVIKKACQLVWGHSVSGYSRGSDIIGYSETE